MINYNKLMNNLETLKLDKMVNFLPNYLDSIITSHNMPKEWKFPKSY